ncbi:MAG: hypothetical protein A4E65_01135 [Syntrophorhabdus sp. PtaU1.Bin153]|nr:MAG: hypothetical protein A4E65_01135 [Syntrophorhabdus sp. PtaU1.Bin153]
MSDKLTNLLLFAILVNREGKGKVTPITLVERQAFLELPIEECRKIMARQAREMEDHYLRWVGQRQMFLS